MTGPTPVRAGEDAGRDAGQIAYEARFAHWTPRYFDPWKILEPEEKAIWARVERACAAEADAVCDSYAAENQRFHDRFTAAEAEVARLTERLVATQHEVTDHGMLAVKANQRTEAAEAKASALRERVARLEEALRPFATYAENMPGADFGEGEIGEYIHGGLRVSIRTQDLKSARAALTEGAPTDV